MGDVAVPAPLEDRVVRREVRRIGVGAGTGLGGLCQQQTPLTEALSEPLPPPVARITGL